MNNIIYYLENYKNNKLNILTLNNKIDYKHTTISNYNKCINEIKKLYTKNNNYDLIIF